jgi:tetratricopeptide (TPR) repeat protein
VTDSLQSQLDAGIGLLRAGRLEEAWKLAESLLQHYPKNREAHLYAADAASLCGDRKAAILCLESLPQTGPGSARVLLKKAQLLFGDSQRAEALKTVRAAAEIVESDERQLRAVARILSDCQDLDGARQWLQRAHETLPDSKLILFDLAVTEFHLNLPDDADQHLDTLLQLAPFHPGALHLRSSLRTQTTESNHVEDLQGRMSQASHTANLLTATGYAFAKEYEDLGQYEESFAALNRGAQAYRSTLNYDSRVELASHEQIRTGFTKEAFSSLAAGFETEGPIFVVGMPRTGTTLVERLLSSHSQVASIGEFRDFPLMLSDLARHVQDEGSASGSNVDVSLAVDFCELGERYTTAARQLTGDSLFFVDKLPYNFLYCGYILAALPGARIIHLTRDPLDTCYAMYKTLFFGAYSYSYDLEELADYFISYHRQMRHWHEVLPGQILDVSYEQLVQEPESQSRRILEWCGLSWEEAVLDFHQQDSPSLTASAMQVREPMHTESIGSWRRAGSGFDPVRERLLQAGLIEA